MLARNLIGSVTQISVSPSYWIATLGGGSSDYGYGVAVDSSGNVYVVGGTASQGAGSYDVIIAKYNKSGVIQWQRSLGAAGEEFGHGIAVDSSGNVYVTGYTLSQGAGLYDVLVAKYNTSGTLQWQRTLGLANDERGYGIAVDSSGNVYVTGYTLSQGAGGLDVLIAKYSTSGTIQWQRSFGGSGNEFGRGIAVDSSGNVYATGRSGSLGGAGGDDLLVTKYNTSGTIQWQRSLGGTSTEEGLGIAVDSSGNVYVTGYTRSQGAGGRDALIAKYDTSGVIQWQRSFGGSGNEFGHGIAVDGSGNVYVTGYTSAGGAGGGDDVMLIKYNTSGTLQWQRNLGGALVDRGNGIAVDSSGIVYVVGATSSGGAGADDILIAKLPSDGSLTGTYGSLIYAATGLTSNTTTLADSARTLTSDTSTLTSDTSTLTSAATTLTSSTTVI